MIVIRKYRMYLALAMLLAWVPLLVMFGYRSAVFFPIIFLQIVKGADLIAQIEEEDPGIIII